MRTPRAHSAAACLALLFACASGEGPPTPPPSKAVEPPPLMTPIARSGDFAEVFGPKTNFEGSGLEEVGRSGLFETRPASANRIAILDNGEASFAARLQALRNAKKSIRIQALIFTGDESGLLIAKILKEKHAAGLDVRVIVDAFSNPSNQTQMMYFDLKQHGIEVEGYEALLLHWVNENKLNWRYHEKMWIIDGETPEGVAIVGGLNIANEYFRTTPENPTRTWRDQDVIVRGRVVKDMVEAFDRNYAFFKSVKESRGIANTDKYWEKTRAVMEKTGKLGIDPDTDPVVVERVATMAAAPVDLRYANARSRFFQNRPRMQETYIEQLYLKAIRESRGEVLISNAYFVASPEFLETVSDAARRCVRVIILTNSPETNDLPALSIVGRKYYDELLAVNDEEAVAACRKQDALAGIQVWEWQGKRAGESELREGTNHGKWAVFDRRVSLVGSHNLDPRSRSLNSETAIVFESEPLSRELARTFYEKDLLLARRISLEEALAFEDSGDVMYELRKDFGNLFEDQL